MRTGCRLLYQACEPLNLWLLGKRHFALVEQTPSQAELAAGDVAVRVGMEASGHARWFERLMAELEIELWIGDAAEIRTRRVRKQKTDRQDAQLILKLMLKDDFPRIWVPSWENRDLRQLLWHHHRIVQARTRVMNQLQAVALNEGLRCKKRLAVSAGSPPSTRIFVFGLFASIVLPSFLYSIPNQGPASFSTPQILPFGDCLRRCRMSPASPA